VDELGKWQLERGRGSMQSVLIGKLARLVTGMYMEGENIITIPRVRLEYWLAGGDIP
jgi:hypothetical protein